MPRDDIPDIELKQKEAKGSEPQVVEVEVNLELINRKLNYIISLLETK